MKYAVIDIGSNSVRLLLWADGHTLGTVSFGQALGGGNAPYGRGRRGLR